MDRNDFQSALTSLFDAVEFPQGGYNEAFKASNVLRAHWKPIISALDAMGPQRLNQHRSRAERMRYEDGATYNPFNNPDGVETSWALEMIPLTITAGEWVKIEQGLIQRAQLLEQIIADIYGPQNLMHSGRIPAELVFANPNFLRPCHRIQPAGNRYLTFYAADLYRAADGRFKVLRDYGSNPTGLGYALENRIVISRLFAELYHQPQVCRLAPFFQTLHHNLLARNSLRGENPGIVLLSSGPESRIYFEQALLSRYLGYPLVEGQDLTVRNGEVFLKKLAGLEPVEVILRHVSDHHSDPFALRSSTATGVAGLIQAAREGKIDIVNPIGCGFADTPALASTLPGLARHLLQQDLLLENHPTWWCGTEEGLAHVTANLDRLHLLPALDRSKPSEVSQIQPDELPAAILNAPYNYMAREPILPSTVPAWDQAGMGFRYSLLRIFVCATENGFAVMPGGLAITALDIPTLLNGSSEEQHSKDIWVLSDQPVAPFSLMSGLQTVSEFKRGNDLPSRVADNLLWLGRYLERAEGLIRLLRSVFQRLSGEARIVDIAELPFLLNLLREKNAIAKVGVHEDQVPRYRELTAQLKAALYQQDRPESVITILRHVQNAARNVRDRLSLDSWRVINRLEDFSEKAAYDPLDLLDNTLFTLNAFSGLAMESITRGLGWRFMDIGRRVERAMNQADLIRMGLPRLCSQSHRTMEALLEISDSLMTYRARYRTVFQLAPVLDLLLADENNPKSLVFQFSHMADHVEHLPRQSQRRFADPEERIVLELLTAMRLLDLSELVCSAEGVSHQPLMDLLAKTASRLTEFAQHISAQYLSRVPTTPHFSNLPNGPKI